MCRDTVAHTGLLQRLIWITSAEAASRDCVSSTEPRMLLGLESSSRSASSKEPLKLLRVSGVSPRLACCSNAQSG